MTAPSVAARMPMVEAGGRARYTWLATTGLLFLAAAPLILLVLSLLSAPDDAGDLVFLAGVGLVALIAAALVWRFGTWAKIVGLILALVATAPVFWIAFGLFAPSSVTDFVPGVLLVLGFLMAVGGNIASLVRRKTIETEAARGEARLIRIALASVALAVVASGIVTLTAKTSVSAAQAEGSVPATMTQFQFSENPITITADQPAKILVANTDPFLHDFAIPALDIDPIQVTPGSQTIVELTAPAGEYTVYCTLHSDVSVEDPGPDAMATKLLVQ